MKTIFAVFSLSALFAFPAARLPGAAPTSSVVTIVSPSYNERARPMAVALVQSADYVCATLEISSRKRDAAAQIADVRQAIQQLAQAVEKSPNLAMHQGPVRFSARFSPLDKVASIVGKSGDGYQTGRLVRVLYRLSADPADVLNAPVAIRELVENLKAAAQADMRILHMELAVDAPERQRERLLVLIRDSADAMKKTFSASNVTIEGLEGPVLVRQVGESQVELYIDYKLTVATGK